MAAEVVEDLIDIDLGEWDGMNFTDLQGDPIWQAYNNVRGSVRPPGGELAIESQARILAQVERLGARHSGETVALVGHGDPLRLLIAWSLGIATDLLPRFDIGTGSLSVLETGDRGPRLGCINCSTGMPELAL